MRNNIFKKTISSVLAFALVTMFAGGFVSAATATSCKISMTEGYAYTLPASYDCDNSSCKSSNTNVATVSEDGKITAVDSGTCTITIADSNGNKRVCQITVQPYSMTCSEKNVTVTEGTAKAVSIAVKNSKSIKAYSSDTSVATVSFGKWNKNKIKLTIKGIKAGTAKIKVYFTNDKNIYKLINVTVNEKSTAEKTAVTKKTTTVPKQTVATTTAKQTAATTKQTTAVTTASKSSASDAIMQVFNLVNEQRAANGLEKLTLDETICKMADVRADEVSTYFSHTRPDGTSCFTIFKDYNYSYTAVGENIAKGQTSAQQVMNDWMNSSGHRANILSSKFTKIGIGYDSATNSWVQLFAA
jgi:uncharacterized protein YkwD